MPVWLSDGICSSKVGEEASKEDTSEGSIVAAIACSVEL